MSEFRIDQITNQNATGGPNVAGITTFTGTSGMVMPSGPTTKRNILENVVTNNLVTYLDAGNVISYPGSGTTWTDLSGYGNNGTLVNGVTYNNTNGGTLTLDGTDDYVIVGTNGTVPPEITISMWIKFPTLEASYFYVNENSLSNPELRLSTNSGFFRYVLYDAGLYFYNQNGNISITTDTWYNLVLVIRDSYLKSYVNLEEDISKTGFTYNGNSTQNSTNHILGTQYVGGYGYQGYNNCTYSNLMVYNKNLSLEEIQQNYNALKGRYI